MIQPDVNVLINAVRRSAPDHERYRDWLSRLTNGREPFAISELVLAGFIRIMTNVQMVSAGADPAEVYRVADFLASRTNCVLVRPGPRQWSIFRRLCDELAARGDVVSDAYHAATAIEWDHEWVSDDRDFARFSGLRWRRPFD